MANYARVSNGVVTDVQVVSDEVITVDGVEHDELGGSFIAGLFGGVWVRTSRTGNPRFNYAGIGFSYDVARDAFIPPTPFPSWSLDEATCQWVAPTPKPDGDYVWDEQAGEWVEA
jgi:hypothetical protein